MFLAAVQASELVILTTSDSDALDAKATKMVVFAVCLRMITLVLFWIQLPSFVIMVHHLYDALKQRDTSKLMTTGVEEMLDLQPHEKLPPKRLHRWTTTKKVLYHVVLAFSWPCIVTRCIIYGLTALWQSNNQDVSDFTNDLCDKQVSSSS